ncbi:UDP-N-acetylmuramoyl-tripeptide--D-alanyl-D-alanine ligase [Marinagarivorans algicola]|uniref:UDP-N-acetylmuramoyl-tripeptide--D-alanyl-D- alanine ligase n=1 Tax=Marinagarivorans algicola TaxID=1513270 RepID=UPI0037358A2C
MKLSLLQGKITNPDQRESLISDCEFSNISTDTRNLQKGDLFVALRGDNFDGHQFIEQAILAGACAIVTDQKVEHCSVPQLLVDDTTIALGLIAGLIRAHFNGVLVAITGSCGKTSVKGLLRNILELSGSTLATQDNYNNHIGVPLTLNGLLPSHDYAVIEIGASGVGEIATLAQIAQPDIALVNNVRAAHVGGFGSIETIASEKGKIYDALNNNNGRHKIAIINCDDAYAPQYMAQTQGLKKIGFSTRSPQPNMPIPVIYATDIQCNGQGACQFTMHFGGQQQAVSLNVLGAHFVANALAAAACALAAGIDLNTISHGLSCYRGEKGRMELIAPLYRTQKATLINDAYNANPASVRAAIDFLVSQKKHSTNAEHKTILVLGNMGELGCGETVEHTSMGLYAFEQGITHVVAIGNLAALAAESFNSTHIFENLGSAAQWLSQYLSHDATILLKGSRSAGIDQLIPLLLEYCKE